LAADPDLSGLSENCVVAGSVGFRTASEQRAMIRRQKDRDASLIYHQLMQLIEGVVTLSLLAIDLK
jgi:hypothetical protein